MIISKTPLRISFVGGGTDLRSYYQYNYGAVVNASINKYIYVIIKESFDKKLHLNTGALQETVDNVNQLKHDITRICLQRNGIKSGIEITSISDIPGGTGLGSSSCYTVGLLNAIYAFKKVQNMPKYIIQNNPFTLLKNNPHILATDACVVEINELNAPIGKQDQYASAFGGINYIQFNADESVNVKPMDDERTLSYLNNNLILFYIGGQRSANSILTEQNKNTIKNYETLNRMRDSAEELYHNINLLPLRLAEGWELKKTLASSISNDYIDEIYNGALKNGAISGKLLGAGSTGFMLFYCPSEEQTNLCEYLKDTYNISQVPIEIGYAPGSEIIYCG